MLRSLIIALIALAVGIQCDRLTFGYGSNMWKYQMSLRCAESKLVGIGRLNGYVWLLNAYGHANIVRETNPTPDTQNYVYGMIYSVTEDDEHKLDRNERVPYEYDKKDVIAEFWPINENGVANVSTPAQSAQVYIYSKDPNDHISEAPTEYVNRMNIAMFDAIKTGIPKTYFDKVVRKYIPREN